MKSNLRFLFLGLTASAACLAAAPSTATGQLAMDWYTIDGGGFTNSTNGALELGGTIGQPDAGAMGSGSTVLYGGFWPVELAPPPCPADYNMDGGIDGADVQFFFHVWQAGAC